MKITPQTRSWIISRLIAHASKDDIILRLVEELGMTWSQAEQVVNEVQQENAAKIEQKQTPLLAGAAVFTFLGGVFIAFYGVYPFWQAFVVQKTPLSLPNLSLITLHYGPGSYGLIIAGLAMIVGSMIGLGKIWGTLLDWFYSGR